MTHANCAWVITWIAEQARSTFDLTVFRSSLKKIHNSIPSCLEKLSQCSIELQQFFQPYKLIECVQRTKH